MSEAPTRRTRLGAAAGVLGAAAAFTMIVGAGPAPSVFQLIGANEDISGNCDEAEHANDPGCAANPTTGGTVDDGSTSSTTEDRSTTTQAPADPTTDVRAIDAAGAGTVLVAVEGGSLRLVSATPVSGWRVEVEQASGPEVEVDFRSGTRRVQVNVELEDGQVRERVRVRDDADGTDIRTEDGAVVRDDSADDSSNSGPGSGDDDSVDDNSGSGSSDDSSVDDNSGSGSSDDSSVDDNSGSGSGDDDDAGDDHGSGGHGSDDD
jgi:hypothetical protein